MNSFLSSLPIDGWQRFLCDALWQSMLIAAVGWFVARCLLRQAAARSWVLLLTLAACVVVPLASLAARANGWGLLAAEKIAAQKNGADSLPMFAATTVDSGEQIAVAATDSEPAIDISQEAPEQSQSADVSSKLPGVIDPTEIVAIDSTFEETPANFSPLASPELQADLSSDQSVLTTRLAPNLFRVAGVAWLGISAILLLRLGLCILATRRLLRGAIQADDTALQTALAAAAQRLGLKTPVRLMWHDQIPTPMVLAFRRPVLLVPANASANTLKNGGTCDWTAAFTHELAHVVRGDGWSRLWAELISIALPCSPLVWLAKRNFRIACEEACDDWVIATGTDPTEFAETLTNWISTPSRPIPLSAIGMSSTKTRTLRILSMKEKPMTTLRRAWRLAAIVAALACISTIAFAQRQGFQQSMPSKSLSDSESTQPAQDTAPPAQKFPEQNGKVKEQISDLERQAAELQKRIEWLKSLETNPPSEKSGLVSFRPYVLEPPDILSIEPVRLVSKEPFKIAPQDKLTLAVEGTRLDAPIRGVFRVDNSGEIVLGPGYGSAHVEGLTRREAESAITEKLKETLNSPEVSVTVDESRLTVGIAGKHLIAPDGTISLGPYGSQYIAGCTILQAQKAVDEKLSKWFKDPIVAIDVYAYNSKVYYVISDKGGRDEYVQRFPITGNETVLDAISQVQGLKRLSSKDIWIVRPLPAGKDQTLKVRWDNIVSGASSSTNYQILPGDRVFIGESKATDRTSDLMSNAPTLDSLGPAVVVKTIPEAGSAEVDPSLAEIKVTFSRAMQDRSWSWCHTSKESFPEAAGDIHYLDDKRTCVMPVKLEPGKTYNIWLNWYEGTEAHNFRDLNGQPSAPYLLVFKTKMPDLPRPPNVSPAK